VRDHDGGFQTKILNEPGSVGGRGKNNSAWERVSNTENQKRNRTKTGENEMLSIVPQVGFVRTNSGILYRSFKKKGVRGWGNVEKV